MNNVEIPITCDICGKEFSSQEKHYNIYDDKEDRQIIAYLCPHCGNITAFIRK